jgi:porphobilinogen synthase
MVRETRLSVDDLILPLFVGRMVRETRLSVDDLILPLFVAEGKKIKKPIASMPGHYQLCRENVVKEAQTAYDLGIPAVILFGIPKKKDALGTGAYAKDGVVQKAVKAIKDKVPGLIVITDVCLCEYTDHGHCGMVQGEIIVNDASLDLLARAALTHAEAGDFESIPIMSYAAKYCSAFYGPFREAAESAPQFGDRRTYQMDPANSLEAIREVSMDVEEGADIVMIKPAMPYLDIISRVRDEVDLPVAAYQVSGEFSMIKAAENLGWLDGQRTMMESLIAIRRAGADMILTYFAKEAAKVLAGR